MKHIEYACYDYSLNESEVESNIYAAIKSGITCVSVLPYSINTIKNIPSIKDKSVSVSCPADFPSGLCDIKTRNFLVTQIAKLGVDYIDLFIPTKIVTNRKYEKFREDVKTNLEICRENNIKLRYILEYRVYNHEVLAKICQILLDFGVDTVIPSSGMMIDDISDNLIACNFLMTKSKVNTICSGNVYTEKHAISLKNMNNLYGLRIFHLPAIDIVLN